MCVTCLGLLVLIFYFIFGVDGRTVRTVRTASGPRTVCVRPSCGPKVQLNQKFVGFEIGSKRGYDAIRSARHAVRDTPRSTRTTQNTRIINPLSPLTALMELPADVSLEGKRERRKENDIFTGGMWT
jgi:hypothetical protein